MLVSPPCVTRLTKWDLSPISDKFSANYQPRAPRAYQGWGKQTVWDKTRKNIDRQRQTYTHIFGQRKCSIFSKGFLNLYSQGGNTSHTINTADLILSTNMCANGLL